VLVQSYGPEEAHRRVIDVADRFRQRLVEQFNFTIEQAENAAEEYLSRARASGTKRFR